MQKTIPEDNQSPNPKDLGWPQLGDASEIGELSIKSVLGKGAFGTVYQVSNPNETNDQGYAAKVIDLEKSRKNKKTLAKENLILQKLRLEIGFPDVADFLVKEKKAILIMSLLGSSLQENLQECGGTFSLKTVLMIGYQALERLEALHNKGFIHRDIKPENFVIGLNESGRKIIHLIDFGLSCPYLDEKNNHIPFNKHPHVAGTLYYISVYGHLGIQATRRDDLISLGFMLIHLFKGQLPWRNVQGTVKEMIKAIYRFKSTLFLNKFCENLPDEFINYFEYVFKLTYFEKPDYGMLKEYFIRMMNNNGIQNDGEFDWISNPEEIKGINLNARKLSSRSPSVYMKKNIESEPALMLSDF